MIDAVLVAPRSLKIQTPNAGAIVDAGDGEVLVEVRAVSLCGSDFKLYSGDYGGPRVYPIRFGHEWSGVILARGPNTRLPVGMRVTGDCSVWCGECDRCLVDKNLCRNIEKFGITIDGFSTARRVVPEKYLYQAPPGMSFQLLALTEIFAVAWRGVQKVEDRLDADSRVLIVGAGSLGLATFLILKHHFGCRQLGFLEPDPEKKSLVRDLFGSPHFVDPMPSRGLGQLTYAEMDAAACQDLVFETSGHVDGLNSALYLAAAGGTIICFSLGGPGVTRTDLLVTKSIRLLGSIGGTGAFPSVLAFFERHGQEAQKLVTHRLPMHRLKRALQGTMTSGPRIKLQFEPRAENPTVMR